MIEQEFKAFREAAMPLMQWLADNRHPHVTVIVDSERAELLEGQANARRVSRGHELEKLEKALAETAHTRPEPSRLEIAAMFLAQDWCYGADMALDEADELIAAAKEGK